MTEKECRELIFDLCAIFPAIDNLFKRAGSLSSPETNREKLLASNWFLVLRDFSLDDAKTAAQRILRGDDAKPPRFEDDAWPRHLALVCRKLEAARRPRRHFTDGQETFKCPTCRDRGTVTVFARKHVKEAERGTLDATRPLYETVVLCDCREWSQVGEFEMKGLVRGRDVPVDVMGDCRDRYAYLCEQVEANRTSEPTHAANYDPSFDAYNNSSEF